MGIKVYGIKVQNVYYLNHFCFVFILKFNHFYYIEKGGKKKLKRVFW